MSADQLRAIRSTAEREIARLDRELKERPDYVEAATERRDWAQTAYRADADLQRLEASYDH